MLANPQKKVVIWGQVVSIMQIQAIRSFLAVYEAQNMTRASEQLFITQQCLSRQIRGVENELGVQLFIRQKSGMQPTELCRKIAPEFKKIISCYDSASALCAGKQFEAPQALTFVLADGMSNYMDISMLSELVQRTGGRDLVIEERPAADCVRMLRAGDADMAFLLEPFDDTMLEHTLIRQDYGCIAVHRDHPLARDLGPVPLAAINGLKTVTGVKTNCASEHFRRYCQEAHVYPQNVASVTNVTGFINRLAQGDIVVLLLSCVIPQITNPDVVIRKVVDPELIGKCHCCFRRGSENETLLRELMEKIRENYAGG